MIRNITIIALALSATTAIAGPGDHSKRRVGPSDDRSMVSEMTEEIGDIEAALYEVEEAIPSFSFRYTPSGHLILPDCSSDKKAMDDAYDNALEKAMAADSCVSENGPDECAGEMAVATAAIGMYSAAVYAYQLCVSPDSDIQPPA